ncbi:MAG: 23S rRNA (pseudouridine(1915)-N(3))-methyltransferase RlmH [Alphaproteobacteria bacterium]|nr:23S rRNA (pseudouridine(1915)-N(3))-methyltransferase RlmH [Alphaproteobacteria bacterium]
MRLLILAGGKAKASPEEALTRTYLERAGALGRKLGLNPITLSEYGDPRPGKAGKSSPLLSRVPDGARLILLDEAGEDLPSAAFAARLRRHLDGGTSDLVFVIGGADGHDAELLGQPHEKIALGRATWPHLLVRAMLAEQIYRALSILSGHPYHRA